MSYLFICILTIIQIIASSAEINIGYIYTSNNWEFSKIELFIEKYLEKYHPDEEVIFKEKKYNYPAGTTVTGNITVEFFIDFLKEFADAGVMNIIGSIPESNYIGFNEIYKNLNKALGVHNQMLWLSNYGLNSVCYMNIVYFNSLCLVSQASIHIIFKNSYLVDV